MTWLEIEQELIRIIATLKKMRGEEVRVKSAQFFKEQASTIVVMEKDFASNGVTISEELNTRILYDRDSTELFLKEAKELIRQSGLEQGTLF